MSNLISRSALLEKEWLTEAVDGYPIRVVEVGDILDAPTIDAVPVIHGRWLGERGSYTCSVCHSEAPDDGGYWASPYCPTCGAKMDLESEGTDE